ncbi:jg6331 [Pararge aegeria aegeria]|uniref:Jg6331 protein n=1 Tax=Pararge aegeria aegeria TaxID=348720 RepID=A0A8S4RST2_9NEOP|nr:jg6331 [Pararge aegeria aegeria]
MTIAKKLHKNHHSSLYGEPKGELVVALNDEQDAENNMAGGIVSSDAVLLHPISSERCDYLRRSIILNHNQNGPVIKTGV